MFFDQMLQPQGMSGYGSPAGLTSPGMSPNSLSALMAMAPQLGTPRTQPGGANTPPNGAAPQPQQMNPQMIMQLLSLLRGGGMGGMGGAMGGMPGIGALGANALGANNAAGVAAGMPSTGY